MVDAEQNRRKSARRPISMQVRYRSLDSFFFDYALNINHGGLFIKTRRPLPRGSEVEIEFELPELPRPFRTSGRVVRVVFPGEDEDEPAGMGIEFNLLPEEDRNLIDLLWQESAARRGGGPTA